jgi:hypothetical protein
MTPMVAPTRRAPTSFTVLFEFSILILFVVMT